MHMSAQEGHEEIVDYLVRCNADPTILNNRGNTAYEVLRNWQATSSSQGRMTDLGTDLELLKSQYAALSSEHGKLRMENASMLENSLDRIKDLESENAGLRDEFHSHIERFDTSRTEYTRMFE